MTNFPTSLGQIFSFSSMAAMRAFSSFSCSTGVGQSKAFLKHGFIRKNISLMHIPTIVALRSSVGICYSCSSSSSSIMDGEVASLSMDAEGASLLVQELRRTFNSGKTKSYEWRVSQLKNVAKMIEEREEEIMEALYQDLAKPKFESFVSEISMSKGSCQLALQDLKKWMMPEKVKTSITTYPSSAEIIAEPFGVVLVISTWNYPILLSLDPVIGAIAAGNAVVLKPSETAPATSSLLANLLTAYLDTSAIRVVEGAVPETTALLEQKWDKILYTGSTRVGRIVMAAAARHLTPVILELGGKCPAIVDTNVDLKVTARRIIAGKWVCNNGQTCIAADYLITTKTFAPQLIEALKRELEAFFGDNPMESPDISRIVNSYHHTRLTMLLDEVSDNIVHGGQRDKERLKIAPTILLDVPENSAIMEEEIFGPLLPILTVENVEDGFILIRQKPKPLAAYLFSDNEQLKKNFVENVSAGGILINDTIIHVTASTLPFGGVGESGMGSYHGKFSFDAFSHKKPVMYRSFKGDSDLRYAPYTPKKFAIMKAVFNFDILLLILALLGLRNEKTD